MLFTLIKYVLVGAVVVTIISIGLAMLFSVLSKMGTTGLAIILFVLVSGLFGWYIDMKRQE